VAGQECPNCHTIVEGADALFCPDCGNQLGISRRKPGEAAPQRPSQAATAADEVSESNPLWVEQVFAPADYMAQPLPPAYEPPPRTSRSSRKKAGFMIAAAVIVIAAGVSAGVVLATRDHGSETKATVTSVSGGQTTSSVSAAISGLTSTTSPPATVPSTTTPVKTQMDLSPLASLQASSTLAVSGSTSYEVVNLVDNDPSTCWAEGVAGYGEGESVTFTFAGAVIVTELRIIPGYDKVKDDWDRWWSNGRVRSFRLDFSDGTSEEHSVADQRMTQTVAFEEPRVTTFVRFTMLSAYPAEEGPNQATDTSVSELHIWGAK
jgi:hypothetical protein